MFESHFGLRENPFASGHQPRFVYPSREHQEALAHLRYGIENHEPFVLITGEVGTGKTTALFEALGSLQERVSIALLTNSALTRGELLEEICLRFNVAVSSPVSKPQAMALLERHLNALRARGERAILLLDEAQNFERDLLEEIRLLSNLESGGEKLLQIILVGQPELEKKLSTPELRQLRQRIGVHYRLRPLSAAETEHYIQHRVSVAGGAAARIFPHEACAAVHAVTNGIPREINQLCAQAMIDAFVEGVESIEPRHVQAAAEETAFQSVLPASETDPRLPPLPAWPPAPAPAAPEPPALPLARAPESGARAAETGARADEAAHVPEVTPAAEAASAPAPPAAYEPTAAIEPTPAVEPPTAVEPTGASVPPPASEPALAPEPEPQRPGVRAESGVDASQWQEWISSLTTSAEESLRATHEEPPAPASPASEPPGAPPLARPSEAAPELPAAAEPAPRFAAESALGPAPGERTTDDWRPPLWTPERARDQMDAEEKRGRNLGVRVLAAVAVLAVLVIAGVWLVRLQPWKRAQQGAPPSTGSTATGPAPLADTARAMAHDSSAAAKAAPVTTPPATEPAPATAPPQAPSPAAEPPRANAAPASAATTSPPRTATAGSSAPPAAAGASVQEYSISVGTYLDRSRAESELARIGGASGLAGRIAAVQREGTTMYAVILGAFQDRVSAEKKASDLIAKGAVDEARILSRSIAR